MSSLLGLRLSLLAVARRGLTFGFVLVVFSTIAQNTAPKSPEVANVDIPVRGINLFHQRWYASADLTPNASAADIVSKGTLTSPTAILRTAPGIGATIFTVMDLSETSRPRNLGMQLTIGDIDGDDETFFNGTKIGATKGFGITDFGLPRIYYIEPGLIKADLNVLAVRLAGAGNRETFGIRREPLTLAFVASPPLAAVYTSPKPAYGETAIPDKDARAAIAAADTSLSSPETLFRKRPSFGRFGKFFHDGLPAVSEVSPTKIATRGGPEFDVVLDSVEDLSIATGADEPGVDGWHKLSRLAGTTSKQPIRYTLLEHVLYPGAILTLEEGNVVQIRIHFPKNLGAVLPLSEAEASKALTPAAAKGISAFALYEPANETVPAIIFASGISANVTQAENHLDATFSRPADAKGSGKIYVLYPTGLRKIDLSTKPATFLDVAAAAEPGLEPAETLRRWTAMALNEPTACDEYFQIHASENVARIYQVARYSTPPGIDPGEPLQFVPPQVGFARDILKYPIGGMKTTTQTQTISFSGPMQCVIAPAPTQSKKKADPKAKAAEPVPLRVVYYDLPIPPMEERGLIATTGNDELKTKLNSFLTELGTSTSVNGVDAIYKSRTQGFQAWSYLTPENRARLADNTRQIVPLAFRDNLWHEVHEPFSGLKFWWTYFIEGPYFDRYDQDWGNGLALYGLSTCVKYTGDWEFAAKNWDSIQKMFAWFTVSDDWEWMRASNGVHGHGTGAGDCESATYAAALSYAKLARGTGHDDEYQYGLYTAARAALLALNRFAYNDFAAKHGFKEDSSYVLGFHEGSGFLVGELDSYPWNVTSDISGNGVQPENFSLYAKYALPFLKQYEETFEQSYPHWADGAYHYPHTTIYRDNSGYITLPHIYLRARLGLDSFEKLSAELKSAESNDYLWWLAPTVIAEVLNTKTQAYVADWGRCAFLGAQINHDKKHTSLAFQFDNKYAPDVVQVAIPRKPDQLQINNGPVPLTEWRHENGILRLRLRKPGINNVTLTF